MTLKAKDNIHLHWQTPALLLCSFLVGAALAVGHHAFYQSLDGKEVSAGQLNIVWIRTTQQQLVSVAGVSIAFVFKASLVLCASIAYVQLFFRSIRTRAFKVETLDHWYAALEDIRSLFCISAYYRYPLLTLVALTAWTLPIAAVFTPAAISIRFDRIDPAMVKSLAVPRPAFDSLAFGSYIAQITNPMVNFTSVSLRGPSAETARIAAAVSAGGEILPIRPPASNTTWNLAFEAPRLVCDDISTELRAEIQRNVLRALQEATANTTLYPPYVYTVGPTIAQYMPTYLAWTNASPFDTEVPFVKSNDKWELVAQRYLYGAELDTNLYFGVFPRALNSSTLGPEFMNESAWNSSERAAAAADRLISHYFEDATLLRCQLVAADYALRFSYTNLDQMIEVVSAEEVPLDTTHISEIRLGIAANKSLDIGTYQGGDSAPHEITHPFKLKSFQAIWQATLSPLLGASAGDSLQAGIAGDDTYGYAGQAVLPNTANPVDYSKATYSTQIFATVLAKTLELYALVQAQPTAEALVNGTTDLPLSQAGSLLPPTSEADANRPLLKDALQELFFNITLSMASSPTLQYNASNQFAPPNEDVTFLRYGTVFSYDSQKLWLAYGIALCVSLVNVVCGLWAMIHNRASFTANFSTIMRLVLNADTDAHFVEPIPGKDPLPKQIAISTLRIR